MKSSGQALIEYLILLALIIAVGGPFIKAFSRYLGDGMGTLNTALSAHLSVGVCASECFPDNYINGKGL